MRKDIADWVTALRSGEYKQCQGTLHRGDTGGFCCLGVYAAVNNIADPKDMAVVFDGDGDLHEGPTDIYVEIRDRLPDRAVEAGIEMNDNGKSFVEIADMIEKECRYA